MLQGLLTGPTPVTTSRDREAQHFLHLLDDTNDVEHYFAVKTLRIRLLGDFALGPYLHDGSAQTFDNVLENVTHRSAGTAGTDTLTDARDRAALVTFLKSIDTSTAPFAIQ